MKPFFALLAFAAAALAQTDPNSYVLVSDPKYAVGCQYPLDLTGASPVNCELLAAIKDAQAGVDYRLYPKTVVLPAGFLHVAAPTLTAAVALSGTNIAIVGQGVGRTILDISGDTGALFQMRQGGLTLRDLTISGNGLATTGDPVELIDAPYSLLERVAILQANGFVSLVGGTERSSILNSTISRTDGLRLIGDTNEDYIDYTEVTESGHDDGGHCYGGVRCVANSLVVPAALYPSNRTAVRLDGSNTHMAHFSVKSTAWEGGIKLGWETSSAEFGYIEGSNYGLNPAIVAGDGALEISRGPNAIGATDTVIAVDDAKWQQPYVTDPAVAKTLTVGGARNLFCIYPRDYDVSKSGMSAVAPTVPINSCEQVSVAGFAGDGNLYLQGTRNGHVFPAGSWVIEPLAKSTYGVLTVRNVHSESVQDSGAPQGTVAGCSDTAQQTGAWIGNPSQICAEVIVGDVPDGYSVPFQHQHYGTNPSVLHVIDTTFYTSGQGELTGMGWIKVPMNGSVFLDQGNGIVNTQTVSATNYGNVLLMRDAVGSTTALGILSDPSGHYYSDTSTGEVEAMANDAWHQALNHVELIPVPTSNGVTPATK